MPRRPVGADAFLPLGVEADLEARIAPNHRCQAPAAPVFARRNRGAETEVRCAGEAVSEQGQPVADLAPQAARLMRVGTRCALRQLLTPQRVGPATGGRGALPQQHHAAAATERRILHSSIYDNGKAERFIQTALREWAYARAYRNSTQRAHQLPHWLHRFNCHRRDGSLNANTPISRFRLTEDNLLMLHN